MRTVVSNEECTHLWAHQKQEHARGSSIKFEGTVIYSYGQHFPMANYVKQGKATCVLFTTGSFGVTTAKHLTMTRRAIPHGVTVFNVPNVMRHGQFATEHGFNMDSYAQRIKEAKETFDKKRKYVEHYAKAIQRLTTEANAYSAFFKLRKRFKQPYTDEQLATMIEAKNARVRQLDETRAARQIGEYRRMLVRDFPRCAARIHVAFVERAESTKKRMAELADRAHQWRSGLSAYMPYDYPTMLRIEGNDVVTSRSARFPVSHARLGLALVERVRASGQPYQRNGHTLHLGPYAIDRITTDGTVHAGCHVVSYDEIARIAPMLAEMPQCEAMPRTAHDCLPGEN